MTERIINEDLAVQQLLKPDAFPHDVTEIKMLETHISWVILSGPFAYKIKKPVDFGFVNYSTLELRKDYCFQEVQLNRRFASDLYLGVVPILKSDGGLCFGKELIEQNTGQDVSGAVEFAVKMQEFPQEAIVAARLHHADLTPGSVGEFGKSIARFHETIESANPTLDCVQAEMIGKDAMDNFLALRQAFESGDRAAELERLERWTAGRFEKLAPVIKNRLNAGMVRRCHGDMHLKNIVQLDGQLSAFDGIEFNEEFQWIDVLSEIAFPVMDFVARGRADLGWQLLNSYLESTGDYGELGVLRFYLVYRAMVRAKVTWLNPRNKTDDVRGKYQSDCSTDEFAGPWDKYLEAARYFAFELAPKIGIMHGFSGSGKSTIAEQIIQDEGWLRIRSDVERQRLAVRINTEEKFSPEMNDWVYLHLLELARSVVEAGTPVLLDATFLKLKRRAPLEALAKELKVDFQIVTCDAPFDELCRRIQDREGDPSEATIEILKQQMETHDPLTTDELQFVRQGQEAKD